MQEYGESFESLLLRETTTSDWKEAIRAAVLRFRTWADDWKGPLVHEVVSTRTSATSKASVRYDPLTRIVVTDEVTRTLFDEYAAHRRSERGSEEIGWQLLGHRDQDSVTVMATLPAGLERDAGQEHVRFNTNAQALGYRILFPQDRQLTVLGIVHTHPGRLRHPSGGDLRGDREWVKRLRGQQGVFGIGTASEDQQGVTAQHPVPNVQLYQGMRFDWYCLGAGDHQYRVLPVEITIGPDWAKPLRPVWSAIEAHASPLDILARQLARVRFEVGAEDKQPSLMAIVPLVRPGECIRVQMMGPKQVRFYFEAGPELFHAELPVGTRPDHGVFLMLAELAARS